MDDGRFDRFTSLLAEDGSTRRRVLGGVAGGGLAAMIASIFGVAGFEAIEADAKRRRRRRRRRRKQQQQTATDNNTDNGVTINFGDTTLFGDGVDLGDLSLEQVLGALDLENTAEGLLELENLIGADAVAELIAGNGITCDTANITIVSLCQTGLCDETTNTCVECPDARVCGEGNSDLIEGTVCCVEGFVCADVGCVVDNAVG